jgi:hypothetical protein
MAPIRSTPDSDSLMRDRSCRNASRSASMRCAHNRTRSPSGVSASNRRPRDTIGTPSSRSSLLIPADNEGWDTWHACAARAKWRSRARATRYSS